MPFRAQHPRTHTREGSMLAACRAAHHAEGAMTGPKVYGGSGGRFFCADRLPAGNGKEASLAALNVKIPSACAGWNSSCLTCIAYRTAHKFVHSSHTYTLLTRAHSCRRYSPEYALRSHYYLMPHALPTLLLWLVGVYDKVGNPVLTPRAYTTHGASGGGPACSHNTASFGPSACSPGGT